MRTGKNILLISAICSVFLLSGCGAWEATKKVGKVIMDPSTKVGGDAEQPSTIQMTLLTEPDINPNEKGEASPTSIAVVYLKEDSKLLAADYDQLSSDALEKTLGKNYIDHQEYTLLPDQYKPLSSVKLEEKARYLGVVAYYADANRSEWKKIIKINGVGHNYHVLVHVRSNEIDLRKEEE
ncbi:type VI secretion system lipoprotein TssJ [Serratia microhaemolytica]|uniref:type VI secretion system lipoprotein TssJ n=1 Tax=Serratia microhaemolytica TaxID=2675110 RepID=UPI000FDF5A24|nr:type VI secretion system lipoprotein TssJ [Serratia microhaemolytica]